MRLSEDLVMVCRTGKDREGNGNATRGREICFSKYLAAAETDAFLLSCITARLAAVRKHQASLRGATGLLQYVGGMLDSRWTEYSAKTALCSHKRIGCTGAFQDVQSAQREL